MNQACKWLLAPLNYLATTSPLTGRYRITAAFQLHSRCVSGAKFVMPPHRSRCNSPSHSGQSGNKGELQSSEAGPTGQLRSSWKEVVQSTWLRVSSTPTPKRRASVVWRDNLETPATPAITPLSSNSSTASSSAKQAQQAKKTQQGKPLLQGGRAKVGGEDKRWWQRKQPRWYVAPTTHKARPRWQPVMTQSKHPARATSLQRPTRVQPAAAAWSGSAQVNASNRKNPRESLLFGMGPPLCARYYCAWWQCGVWWCVGSGTADVRQWQRQKW